jgi:RNA polymerase sigma-70 factor (ECF subfamily)
MTETVQLQAWLEQMGAGDRSARDQLIAHVCDLFQVQAHRMLKGYPGLKRWVDTGDVFQNAMLRLLKALQDVPPESVRHFLGLASLQIRRELVDMLRHYHGPQGMAAHHHTDAALARSESGTPPAYEQGDLTADPSRLAAWCEFHEQAGQLPPEEQEVFDLLWYQELPQAEAASLLGVSERTIKRRWQAARVNLHEALQGLLPEG